MQFRWDMIQHRPDGKVLLLYRHERLFDEGLIKSGMDILDVGGWGHLTERMEQEGAHAHVLDNMGPDQYYPDRVKKGRLIVADICTCHVRAYTMSNLFDVITCFETLEHVADQDAALKNIFTMVRPSGVFAGTVPIPGFCHFIGEPGITLLDEQQLRDKLTTAGFVDIFIEPTGSVTKDEVPSSLYFRARKP
jgi:SAM-dependent methyltransferase